MEDEKLISEFGCLEQVNFAKTKSCDGEGKEIMCGCGNPATQFIYGEQTYVCYCDCCIPYDAQKHNN